MPGNNRFWNFIKDAAQPDEAELFLWGPIASETWYGDEVTPQQFKDDLMIMGDVKSIVVRINSPGGDVFAAIAISGILRDHPARITSRIDGLCASAATIIPSNSDWVQVSAGSLFMIHDPWSVAMGSAEDMTKMAEVLNKCKETIIAAYKTKTGMSEEELSSMMSTETWMNAQEAIKLKFADELIGKEQAPAASAFKLGSVYASLRDKFPLPPLPHPTETELLHAELELLSL